MSRFTDRMIRAAKLDANLYEEVEADRTALGQAMGVVVLASLAAGIGAFSKSGMSGLVMGSITALIGWFVWSFIVYFVGTKILPEPQTKADLGQLLRTIGFSSSPGIIRVLGIIPGLMVLTSLIGSIWMLIAMVIAVRQALDYKGTGRAVGVVLIGWLIAIILTAILGGLIGGMGAAAVM